jgi:hypothetical protein
MSRPPTPSFREYSLPDTLEHDITLVLDPLGDIVTLKVAEEIAAHRVVSEQEMALLVALLEAHLQPCANATLYAALTGIPQDIVQELLEAVGDYVPLVMKPVARVLRSCRATLEAFNLGIEPVGETAYKLFRLEP